MRDFTFNISLTVLNHLGRNLYRSFATLLGEAISNAWDADAKNVYINIDKENNEFYIMDDGVGMNREDFQTKFLRIGYSKREHGISKSANGRPFIGRKGIGKLALLSCADKITVISRMSATDSYIGGTIDNSKLDKAIKKDLDPEEYTLGQWVEDDFSQFLNDHTCGTIIKFENVREGIRNSYDFLRRVMALYFRFSLVDKSFDIYINNKKITLDDLNWLAHKTQFLWNINELKDEYIDNRLTNLLDHGTPVEINLKEIDGAEEIEGIDEIKEIKGFIASVEKPSNLKVTSTEEKASVDLFINGRLREKDILKHIPTARVTESYFYGQIHFDSLDEGKDRSTSSREGIIADDPVYSLFLRVLRDKILKISEEWDTLRIKHREDGDSENPKIPPKKRKAGEFVNAAVKEYRLPKDSSNHKTVNGWVNDLNDDAEFNVVSYIDCFVSENLLRNKIDADNAIPTTCVNFDVANQQTCLERSNNRSLCVYCKSKATMENLSSQKSNAGTSIQVRKQEDNPLMYLDYADLGKITDNQIIKDQGEIYKLIRNAVMHTSRVTDEAQRKLGVIYDEVLATIKSILR